METLLADYDLLRCFKQGLELAPAGVSKAYLRSDAAGYVVDLLKYCAEGKNNRFGVLEFAIGVTVTEAFRVAVGEVRESEWHRLFRIVDGKPVETGQERAEVCFAPSWVGHRKDGPIYRYLADS